MLKNREEMASHDNPSSQLIMMTHVLSRALTSNISIPFSLSSCFTLLTSPFATYVIHAQRNKANIVEKKYQK